MNLIDWLNLLHFAMEPFHKHGRCSDRELCDSLAKTAITEGGEFNELHTLMMNVHTCLPHEDWLRVKAEQKLQTFLQPRGISYEPNFIGPFYR